MRRTILKDVLAIVGILAIGAILAAGTYVNGVEIINSLSITETTSGTTVIPVGGITTIGDAGNTSHLLNTNDDLYVTGKLEVDGVGYFDAITYHAAANRHLDNITVDFGTGNDAFIYYNSNQTPDSLAVGVGDDSKVILFHDKNDFGTDFKHAQQSNATLAIQSSDANSIYGAGYIAHDNDDFTFQSLRGGFSFEVPAQYAQGTLTMTDVPLADETFVINATTVTAKDSGASTDEFNIGASAALTATAIAAAVNAGTEAANVKAWASGDTVVFEWRTAGTAGNAIVFTEAMTNTTVDGGGTLGGTHAGIAAGTPLAVNESTGTTIANGLVIPSGATPAPDTLGALFLDTDAGGGDGSLMMYTASGWETVKDFN